MGPAPDADVVLNAADIARLTGVRRPAVSNWRRRFPDFPQPVAGTATHPLFSWREVEAWCAKHNRTFAPTPADRLWQRAEAVVGAAHLARFLAHTGLRLAAAPPPEQLPPPESHWAPLLTEAEHTDDPVALYAGLYERFRETWARQEAEVPPELAGLMAELAEVTSGETVLDPACGTGPLATAAAHAGAATLLLQDRDPIRGAIALARILLAGRQCRLAVGDALHDDSFAARDDHTPADAVLCAPPGEEQSWDQEGLAMDPRWVYGLPPRGESGLAWVQHCLTRARPGGRVAIRVPTAAANRRSGRRIRTNLLRAGALRAVVEVPPNLGPGTHIWLLRRPETDDPTPKHLFTVSGAPDPTAVRQAWATHRADPDSAPGPYATRVPLIDVLGEDVDLTPPPSGDLTPGPPLTERIATLRGELDAALTAAPRLFPEIDDTPRTSGSTTSVVSLLTQGLLELHRCPAGMPTDAGPLPVLTAQDLRLGRAPSGHGTDGPGVVHLRDGDVIVPPRGEGRPRVAREAERGVALGPALTVLRPVGDALDPDFLAGFLTEDPRSRRGSSSHSGVRAARIPALPLAEQRACGAALRRLAETEEHLRRLAESGRSWADLVRNALRTGSVTPATSPEGLPPPEDTPDAP